MSKIGLDRKSLAPTLIAFFVNGEMSIGEGEGDSQVRALKRRGLIRNTEWRKSGSGYSFQYAEITDEGREIAASLAKLILDDIEAAKAWGLKPWAGKRSRVRLETALSA